MQTSSLKNSFVRVAISLLMLVSALPAQQPAHRTVLRAGKLLDVKSGKLLERDKIASIGPSSDAKSTAKTDAINAGDVPDQRICSAGLAPSEPLSRASGPTSSPGTVIRFKMSPRCNT